jgi:hypothetical protein
MEQFSTNIGKILKSPGTYLPFFLKNIDVVIYALAVFLFLLPYIVFKKIARSLKPKGGF